jgi:hypothetical protein
MPALFLRLLMRAIEGIRLHNLRQRLRRRKRLLRVAYAACALGIVVFGCRNEVELGNALGVVTIDGKPAKDLTIRFVPIGGGRSALGRTDENGFYEMQYSATASGALVGPVRVEITAAEEETDAAGNSRMKPETIPARYNMNSELKADVGSGDNSFDFDLEAK